MTTQLQLEAIEGAAPLQSRPRILWQGYTPDADFEWAEQDFEKRHGHRPETLTRFGGWLRVGPIEEGV